MGTGKQYDEEFKKEAVKLAKEVGNNAAAKELGMYQDRDFTIILNIRINLGNTKLWRR